MQRFVLPVHPNPRVAEVLSYWSLGKVAPLRSKDGNEALIVTRDPARMLPAVDNRTVEIKQGDRVA